jgi:hypothetical protein
MKGEKSWWVEIIYVISAVPLTDKKRQEGKEEKKEVGKADARNPNWFPYFRLFLSKWGWDESSLSENLFDLILQKGTMISGTN